MKNILSFVFCIILIGLSIILSCKKKNEPPNIPAKPTGPDSGQVGLSYTFSTSTVDNEDDSISYQFNWGDSSSNWSNYKSSSSSITMSKTWQSLGACTVRARAKDIKEHTSEWSEGHQIIITAQITGGPPTNFTIEAASDTTVKLTWSAPNEGTPDKYIVFFKAITETYFANVGEVFITTYTHNPAGNTGTYYVSAKFGSNEYDSPTKNTIPISTAAIVVGELNSSVNSGYGWNRADGLAATYSMFVSANTSAVDLYISNWVTGYAGTPYYVISPDLGPTDPGGVVPTANWRINYISDPITNPQAPLPKFSIGTYFSWTSLIAYPTYLAIRMPDGSDAYYALIKVDGLNTTTGTVQVESWFQLIKGLRLIKH